VLQSIDQIVIQCEQIFGLADALGFVSLVF